MARTPSFDASRKSPKPNTAWVLPENWIEQSRKAQRKAAETAGHKGCRWVGGKLYDGSGNEIPKAPALPKVGPDGNFNPILGWVANHAPERIRAPVYQRASGRFW